MRVGRENWEGWEWEWEWEWEWGVKWRQINNKREKHPFSLPRPKRWRGHLLDCTLLGLLNPATLVQNGESASSIIWGRLSTLVNILFGLCLPHFSGYETPPHNPWGEGVSRLISDECPVKPRSLPSSWKRLWGERSPLFRLELLEWYGGG